MTRKHFIKDAKLKYQKDRISYFQRTLGKISKSGTWLDPN